MRSTLEYLHVHALEADVGRGNKAAQPVRALLRVKARHLKCEEMLRHATVIELIGLQENHAAIGSGYRSPSLVGYLGPHSKYDGECEPLLKRGMIRAGRCGDVRSGRCTQVTPAHDAPATVPA